MPTFKPSKVILDPPSWQERKRNIDAIRWYMFDKFEYEPHLDQLAFHIAPERFRTLTAGTRGGKSRAAGEETTLYLLAGATRVWIVGQNYSLTEKEFRYVYQRLTSPQMWAICGGNPIASDAYNPKQGDMHITTAWGSHVECISLERPRGAFGEEVDLIVLSEAAQIKNPRELYERILYGRLSTRHGDVIIPTTPAGKTSEQDPDGWLYEMFQRGLDVSQEDYFSIGWPSWANPTFSEDPLELRSWMCPLRFAEQYEGRFVDFSGSIFTNFNSKIHVLAPFTPPGHWRRYEAIDPGYSGKFVWISGVISESGILIINDEYSDEETLYEQRADMIRRKRAKQYGIPWQLWDRFKNKNNLMTTTYIDNEDPQCAAELARLGIPCISVNKKDIMVSVDKVNRRLAYDNVKCPTLFVTSNCVDTLEALQHHKWGKKGAKDIRKPANDPYKHWADCLRYICNNNLLASEKRKEVMDAELYDEPTYGDLLEELYSSQSGQARHPHDYYEQRMRERRVA